MLSSHLWVLLDQRLVAGKRRVSDQNVREKRGQLRVPERDGKARVLGRTRTERRSCQMTCSDQSSQRVPFGTTGMCQL